MTLKRTARCLAVLLAVISGTACERAKSANPLSPDVAGPIPGVDITAPAPLEPGVGAQIVKDGNPQTLVLANATTSGVRELWIQVEVASDGAFTQVVHQADRVAPGTGGRTSYRLPAPLGPGHTYYWRARALDGANTGPYSAVAHFSVVDPVVIEAPQPFEPSGALTTNRPDFRAKNGRISGTTNVVYRFEIATAPDPAATVAVVTATPGSAGTTSMSLGELPWNKTFYWRMYATDGTTISPFSTVLSFKTPAAPAPGGGAPGGGAPGGGTPGGGTPGGGAPGGGGGGARTPDPPPGQRLPLPNMSHIVQQVAASRPDLLRNSCQESGGSWGFMDLVVDTLRQHDTRWGYNWKRGNVGDPSKDVVDYHWGAGADEGSTEVYIIDVIGGHCGSSPSAGWGDVTAVTYGNGGVGRWTARGRF